MDDEADEALDSGVTYGATVRPGLPDAESVNGLGQDELDEWLAAHARNGDAFTYLSIDRNGDVLVRGDGRVHDGEAFYRLAP